MSKKELLVALLWVIAALIVAAPALITAHQRPIPVEFYWEKPTHCVGRSFTLNGSWSSPNEGGATVWVCR